MIALLCRETLPFHIAVRPLHHAAYSLLTHTDFLTEGDLPSNSVVDEAAQEDESIPPNGANDTGIIRLSRPQRKALDRAKKARLKTRTSILNHSTRSRGDAAKSLVNGRSPVLHAGSTFNEVLSEIKRVQKTSDIHNLKAISSFLLDSTTTTGLTLTNAHKGSLLSRLAVAALQLKNAELASTLMAYRRANFLDAMLPMESVALVRNLLRVDNVKEAYHVLELELSLPDIGIEIFSTMDYHDTVKYRAEALASIAAWYFFEGQPREAVLACRKLASMGRVVQELGLSGQDLQIPLERLLQGASKCQSLLRTGEIADNKEKKQGQQNKELSTIQIPCNVVYSVLDVMMSLPFENHDRVFELLSNALVRRVVFVTGAVTMDGCPIPDRGEAAFIGRSNVGKSSLVNMITNRKSLAYISKSPGKTQQFNFFAVNDKPGREQEIKYGDVVDGEKDTDSFYIVDVRVPLTFFWSVWSVVLLLKKIYACFFSSSFPRQLPGFGYAKVSEQRRQEWSLFMRDYIATRTTLRVLFHLVDSRHGPSEEDAAIMKQVDENLPPHATYVIVLTKADKNAKSGGGESYSGKVSQDVMQKLQNVMAMTLKKNKNNVPVVLTSAESKLGRDELWSYLRRAAMS